MQRQLKQRILIERNGRVALPIVSETTSAGYTHRIKYIIMNFMDILTEMIDLIMYMNSL